MGLEHEPFSIEAALETFREDLDDAGEFTKEFEAETPLQNLPSFEELMDDKGAMVEVLMEKFGVSPTADPVKEYSTEGTPGTEGEGEIEVRVFATNDPEVFLGQYTHENGDVDWTVRPLEVEEFEEDE